VLRKAHFFEHVGDVDVEARKFTILASTLAMGTETDSDAQQLVVETSFKLDLTRDGKEMERTEKIKKNGEPAVIGERKRRRDETRSAIMRVGSRVQAAFLSDAAKKKRVVVRPRRFTHPLSQPHVVHGHGHGDAVHVHGRRRGQGPVGRVRAARR
jgi:hypothetical protein